MSTGEKSSAAPHFSRCYISALKERELPENDSKVAYINNSLYLARKFARIFFRGHHLFRGQLSASRNIMSKDKFQSIFSPPIRGYCVYILPMFFATCAVLKIGEHSRVFPSFRWGKFGHVTCLDQLSASEDI